MPVVELSDTAQEEYAVMVAVTLVLATWSGIVTDVLRVYVQSEREGYYVVVDFE